VHQLALTVRIDLALIEFIRAKALGASRCSGCSTSQRRIEVHGNLPFHLIDGNAIFLVVAVGETSVSRVTRSTSSTEPAG